MRPIDAKQVKVEEPVLQRMQAAFLYGGIFIISCAIILFEICLLRIFSVIFLHHFAFAIVSIALLGLGLGGVVVHVFERKHIAKTDIFKIFSRLSNFFAAAVIIFIFAASLFPSLSFMTFVIFALAPFVIGGAIISWAFETFSERLNRIYLFNLLGSAVGSIAVLYALNIFGGINAIFFVGLLATLAGLMFATAAASVKKMIVPAIVFFIFLFLLLFSCYEPLLSDLPININADKEIHIIEKERSTKVKVLETRWSAFGRTDLVEFADNPLDKDIFIDGTSGTPMYYFDGNLDWLTRKEFIELKYFFIGAFPYYYLDYHQKESALIIGPGGGRDVLVALLNGIRHITAVDVNADLIDIVKKYSCYNGGIYTNFNNVDVVAEEGRSFLKSTDKKFDLIILPLAVVKTSRSAEGYTLTENYLYTTDAIKEYLEHLTDDGQLVFILHGKEETYRVISILMPVFTKMGLTIPQAMEHMYVVGREKITLLAAKKNAFDRDEIFARHALAHKLQLYKGYEKDRLIYFPYLGWSDCKVTADMLIDIGPEKSVREEYKNCNRMDKALMGLTLSPNLNNWLKILRFDTKPVTDNRPFFYNTNGTPPDTIMNLLHLSIIIIIGSIFIPPLAAFLSGGASMARNVKTLDGEHPGAIRFSISRNWRYIIIFFLLGAGFMMVEIVLIQKFILFLGQPVLSLSIMLLALFIGMGFGGSMSKAILRPDRNIGIPVIIGLLIGMIGVYIVILPIIFIKFLGCTLLVKALISICLIAPLGALMGMPFPSMLDLLKQSSREAIIPWMWGINGVSSVFGSTIAVVIGILFGFDKVLLVGILMYAAIIAILKIQRPANY